MKKKLRLGILILLTTAATIVYADYYNYSRIMDHVQVVHYIAGTGSGYSTVYLTAIVPEEKYHKNNTIAAIRRYVIYRNFEVPDTLHIVLYDTMEQLSNGESYFEITLYKELP